MTYKLSLKLYKNARTRYNARSFNDCHTKDWIKIGCGLDQMNWQDVVKLIRNIFAYSDIQNVVYSLDEQAIHAMSAEEDPELYAEDEIDRYSEEFHLIERELETDFASNAKSCQPVCDEQFRVLRPEEQNEALIEHYLQYQPES